MRYYSVKIIRYWGRSKAATEIDKVQWERDDPFHSARLPYNHKY